MKRPANKGHGAAKSPCAANEQYCRLGHRKEYVCPQGRVLCRICRRRNMRKRCEARRKQRFKDRQRRIAQRHSPPEAECIWAAGYFEGEGTVTLHSTPRAGLTRPEVSMASTDKSMVEYFHARWPGTCWSYIPKSKNSLAREAFCWRLGACDTVECFLLDILPHLASRRVRKKADLLIEDIRDRLKCGRTPEVRQRKKERLLKMRELNRRGIRRAEERAGLALPQKTGQSDSV